MNKFLSLICLVFVFSCSSKKASQGNFDFSSYVSDNKEEITKVLMEKWGADTAFVEYLGNVPDSLYKQMRDKYNKDYPSGTYINLDGKSQNVSMDEYFEDYPQTLPIFRIYLTRRDKETVQGVNTVDLGGDVGVKGYIGNVDYISRNYYILTGTVLDDEFYIFSSDSRFYYEYENFTKIIKKYTEISEGTTMARFIKAIDDVKVEPLGENIKWLDNFPDYYNFRSSVLNQHKCGCDDGQKEIIDIDGNHYRIIQIGSNCWMKDNLKVSRFSNGDTIHYISKEDSQSFNYNIQDSNVYVDYNFDKSNFLQYGYLYNGKVVVDNRNVCPVGWHVPNDSDYFSLIKQFDTDFDESLASSKAGAALKEGFYDHWKEDNFATNSSGLSLVGGGNFQNGTFDLLKANGFYWLFNPYSADEYKKIGRFEVTSFNEYVGISHENYSTMYSIRCIKNK